MNIQENVSLAAFSTMRLGGQARYLSEAHDRNELKHLYDWAKQRQLPVIVVGSGSNIVWRDEGFNGLVLVNKIMGREVVGEDGQGAIIKAAAGENWDNLVDWTVDHGLSGIEFMSAIPGTVGAAPVQNIGAYGAELSSVLTEVEVYDTQAESFDSLPAADCGFSYRSSRFKTADRGRFLILSITLRLHKNAPQPPFYESLQKYFDEHKIADFSPAAVRAAVIAIRKIRLPDPSVVNNNGSFFTNPIIERAKFEELKSRYPEIIDWPANDDKVKISAGWLVEQAGFKGVHDEPTGMATWDANALVLVNERARSTADLLKFKQKITDKVSQMFGVSLEQEPEVLP